MVAVVFAAHMTFADPVPVPVPVLPLCVLDLACVNLCPNGVILDVGGCKTCICKDVCKGLHCIDDDWWAMPEINTTNAQNPSLDCICGQYCDDKECPKKCAFGYVKNTADDCHTCECASPCPLRKCPPGLTVRGDVDVAGHHVCVCVDVNGLIKRTLPGLGDILGGLSPLPIPILDLGR